VARLYDVLQNFVETADFLGVHAEHQTTPTVHWNLQNNKATRFNLSLEWSIGTARLHCCHLYYSCNWAKISPKFN
jgi:hypothetical protein